MKTIFILSILTFVSAFGHQASNKKLISPMLESMEVQRQIDYLNTQTKINQELFKIRINKLKTN